MMVSAVVSDTLGARIDALLERHAGELQKANKRQFANRAEMEKFASCLSAFHTSRSEVVRAALEYYLEHQDKGKVNGTVVPAAAVAAPKSKPAGIKY
jgi:hypothetical protein